MADNEKRKRVYKKKPRLYTVWQSMKARCDKENATNFKWYGAKGVRYCDAWKYFDVFRKWALQNGYADNMTLDRIDTSGNYAPENCRWVSWKAQQNNRSNNRIITIDGETHTLSEWSDIYGISTKTIQSRLRYGWSERDAITTPKRRDGKSGRWLCEKRQPDRDERGRWKATRKALP